MMTIAWCSGFFVILAFAILLKYFKVVHLSKKTLEILRETIKSLADGSLSDLKKEQAMKSYSLELFKCFVYITIGSILALLLPLVLVLSLDFYGLMPFDYFLDSISNWQFIAVSTLFGLTVVWLFVKITGNSDEATKRIHSEINADSSFVNSYSKIEQFVHYIAFATKHVQIKLSVFEDRLFRRQIEHVKIEHPVFITGLPRSGTTLMLELLENQLEFASHSYRNMPFLLTPLFWDRISSRFKVDQEKTERAHGDGMLVNTDSPEAFEELIWNIFWRNQYKENYIVPWTRKKNHKAFEKFLVSHFKKIICLQTQNQQVRKRYLSKNNLNISRLPYLLKIFPDAVIVVLFRSPLRHAYSMLKQHRNFLLMHREDDFAKFYMGAIGHYDFGENFKPVNFANWLEEGELLQQDTLDFWLKYWVATYKALLSMKLENRNIHFVCYEGLCENPKDSLQSLSVLIDLVDSSGFLSEAETIKKSGDQIIKTGQYSDKLLGEAESLFVMLCEQSILSMNEV